MRVFALVLCALSACAQNDGVECLEGACPPGLACIDDRCRCVDDQACGPGAFCNDDGACQARPLCRSNRDCALGERCATNTGRCIVGEACTLDVQCAVTEICRDGRCQPGCRDDGDCPLNAKCRPPANSSGLGMCVVGACDVNEDCVFGSRCVGGGCFPSPNPSHCAPCGRSRCPFPGDFCLVNRTYNPARDDLDDARFCGVGCEGEPEICPSGYACETVVRLTEQRCTRERGCGIGRECIIEESAAEGFCTCATTSDCPNNELTSLCRLGFCDWPIGQLCSEDADCSPLPLCDTHRGSPRPVCFFTGESCRFGSDCLCVQGECLNSNRPCASAEDCFIRCDQSLCRVGEACTPRDGLTCNDVR